jgi:4'-phosphopantetheinyl transferase
MQTPSPQSPAPHPIPRQDEIPLAGGSLQSFELRRPEACYAGWFAAVGVEAYEALKPCVEGILHPDELRYFVPLPAERRRISFLLGRYAAKRALRACLGSPNYADINIVPGIFKNPVVCYPMKEPWQVSITHSDAMVCAIAFPMVHPMALDVESIDAERVPAMATQCQESERAEAAQIGLDVPTACTLLWTAKEALSKTLHTGMTCPFEWFEVHSIKRTAEAEFQGLYKNLGQYKFHSWIHAHCVLTLTLPRRTDIVFESGRPCLPSTGC